MNFSTDAFANRGSIPAEYAFGVPDPSSHLTFGPNRNPGFAWGDLPVGTRSLVLVCHDPDVPSVGDDVNQEGREVPADLPRVDFYHWALVDIPPDKGGIAAGEYSQGVTARGKTGPECPDGTRQGINDYTGWFAGDPGMEGTYFGYDGPCPPWNDTIVHNYHFTLYALDLDGFPLDGDFQASEASAAITGHVLDRATVVGTYSLNPAVPA